MSRPLPQISIPTSSIRGMELGRFVSHVSTPSSNCYALHLHLFLSLLWGPYNFMGIYLNAIIVIVLTSVHMALWACYPHIIGGNRL